MAETCVTPTFTEVEPDLQIFPPPTPPCLPDAVTQAPWLETEGLLDLLTEDNLQLLLEED